MNEEQHNEGRREFVKKAAYVAPVILTLAAAPAYAKAGSEKPGTSPAPSQPPSTNPSSWLSWLLKKLLGLA
jgi:hypothetical protein